MLTNIPYRLYVKRVLRGVPHHSGDTYIDRTIAVEIEKKVLQLTGGSCSDADVRAAVQKLEPYRKVSRRYKSQYRPSAAKPDGIVLFERFFDCIAAMALLLVVALAVFRLWPQREYVAYGFCFAAGIAAGYLAHRMFYNLGFCIATAVVPGFLLLYYPVKDVIGSGAPFWDALFSWQYHNIFWILAAMLLGYLLSTAFFHGGEYLSGAWHVISRGLAVLLAAAAVAAFAVYAVNLRDRYDREALDALRELRSGCDTFLAGGSSDTIRTANEKLYDLYERYAGIYVPEPGQTEDHMTDLVKLLDASQGGADAVMKYYHPNYDETDPLHTLDRDALTEKLKSVRDGIDLLIAVPASERGAMQYATDLEARISMLWADFYTELTRLYNDWIYSAT